jgi:hypothetical protein
MTQQAKAGTPKGNGNTDMVWPQPPAVVWDNRPDTDLVVRLERALTCVG